MEATEDPVPEPEPDFSDVLEESAGEEESPENEIEKPKAKPGGKKPRTKAQKEAFAKAQGALAAKRQALKEAKAQEPKPRRGRPPSQAKPKPKKAQKRVVYEVPDEPEDTSSEEEVVYVQRNKPRAKKPKAKKAPRVVYVTDSSDEETQEPEPQPKGHPTDLGMFDQMSSTPPTMQDWYNFV